MELWILYAAFAAVFAAATTILAKIGLKGVSSNLAAAVRTMVVLVFAWVIVFIVGSQGEIGYVEGRTWVFLVLSGFATGGAWLCYFRALQLGRVSRVVPISKSSPILAMILAFIFLREPVGWVIIVGMVLMGMGTWLMIELKKDSSEEKSNSKGWLFFAVLSAVFAALTSVLGRAGMVDSYGVAAIEANLGTAIRTVAVVPMAWLMVFITGEQKNIGKVDGKSWIFLVLSGFATGASWLFFYRALQLGTASRVVPIDKLSIVLTMGFAFIFFREKFSKRSIVGLILLVVGTLLPVVIA